jgi:UDP-N-acetylmuramoylalanine--D-glutamate ligase
MNIAGRTFGVLGAARSGRAVAGLLRRRGATVLVSDRAARDQMAEAARELEAAGIEAEFGGHSQRLLRSDALVISPGVPSDAPIVQEALARGVEVISELEVASWFHRGPMLAITGTNGKTTTTTLAGRIFTDARLPSAVAGNIGVAFSQVVESIPPGGTAILEVSSFQLDHVREFRPAVSVLLNITPDHLDRYGNSFERYAAAKARVFAQQRSGDTLVYNRDDEVTARLVAERADPAIRRMSFGLEEHPGEGAWVKDGMVRLAIAGRTSDLLPAAEISIPGRHNLYNAMSAVLAGRVSGVGEASMRATLRNFRGVEHRLEVVRERNGVTFVNDSKATNVDSVWYALQSYSAPIVLMLGGRDKGNDYRRLEELVRRTVREIVAIGESADKVAEAFTGVVPVRIARTMAEAVQLGAGVAQPGDIVLLSPACASFDWFDNYEHRGRVFAQLVREL